MKTEETFIKNLLVVTIDKYTDNRGSFQEQYSYNKYKNHNIGIRFIQDNLTFSKKNVLRGLHFQTKKPQAKLVSVIDGEIFDVAVDIRVGSKTYLHHFSIYLSGLNNKQLFIPEGFAHGFYVISDYAYVNYKCSDNYDPKDQDGIIWNDSTLNINWPLQNLNPIISDKDKNLPGINI